jgi:very-short-patch-repair endonuclease
VLEVDGGQHAESERDEQRTVWLEAQGWRVVRFWNNDVRENAGGVAEVMLSLIQHPHPSRLRAPTSPAKRAR